jgi:hypothetical protein
MKVSRATIVLVEYGSTDEEATDKLSAALQEVLNGDGWDQAVSVESEVDTDEEGLDEDILE